MTHPGQAGLAAADLVLHALRCTGFASAGRVAAAAGFDEADVESLLIDLAVAGLVTHEAGDFGGWGVTEAGRAADAARGAREIAATGTRPAVVAAYERFLPLNQELLDLCGAWQMRSIDGVAMANDHTDAAYDDRVLDRLGAFHGRAAAVLADLAAALPRFGRYRDRLAHALSRARAGALDHVTDSMASYHTVWFELHEDLLTTLGIPRWGIPR